MECWRAVTTGCSAHANVPYCKASLEPLTYNLLENFNSTRLFFAAQHLPSCWEHLSLLLCVLSQVPCKNNTEGISVKKVDTELCLSAHEHCTAIGRILGWTYEFACSNFKNFHRECFVSHKLVSQESAECIYPLVYTNVVDSYINPDIQHCGIPCDTAFSDSIYLKTLIRPLFTFISITLCLIGFLLQKVNTVNSQSKNGSCFRAILAAILMCNISSIISIYAYYSNIFYHCNPDGSLRYSVKLEMDRKTVLILIQYMLNHIGVLSGCIWFVRLTWFWKNIAANRNEFGSSFYSAIEKNEVLIGWALPAISSAVIIIFHHIYYDTLTGDPTLCVNTSKNLFYIYCITPVLLLEVFTLRNLISVIRLLPDIDNTKKQTVNVLRIKLISCSILSIIILAIVIGTCYSIMQLSTQFERHYHEAVSTAFKELQPNISSFTFHNAYYIIYPFQEIVSSLVVFSLILVLFDIASFQNVKHAFLLKLGIGHVIELIPRSDDGNSFHTFHSHTGNLLIGIEKLALKQNTTIDDLSKLSESKAIPSSNTGLGQISNTETQKADDCSQCVRQTRIRHWLNNGVSKAEIMPDNLLGTEISARSRPQQYTMKNMRMFDRDSDAFDSEMDPPTELKSSICTALL